MWATFVFNKTELEAPVTVAKKKANQKIRVKRQNKKDDELMILDEELLKPKGKKKRTVDAGELEKGKKKKRTDDDEVPQGKKKRIDDEEVPQGKEAEEATSANDDKRQNVQLQAAKKEFRAFVQSNDVKPENYVSTLKKFFGQNQMMSSLWADRAHG